MRSSLLVPVLMALVACADSGTSDTSAGDAATQDTDPGTGDGSTSDAGAAPDTEPVNDTAEPDVLPDAVDDTSIEVDGSADVDEPDADDAVSDGSGEQDGAADAPDDDATDAGDTGAADADPDVEPGDTADDTADLSDATPDVIPDTAVDSGPDPTVDTTTDTAADVADVAADVPDTTPDAAADVDATGDVVDDGCPDELFVVSPPDPANTEYPDPELTARCTDTTLIVESNAIIGYEYQAMTPNPLEAQAFVWEIPLTPTALATPVDIPLLGTVGFTRNGIPIYGPNEGPIPDPYGDPIYNAIVDWCLGHTGGDADYHYHAILAECVLQDPPAADGPSPILGFALDGYPIYGPRACVDVACTEIIEVRSGWVATGDPTTYAWDNHSYVGGSDRAILDECNGRVQPDGSYGYHATETFPYVLGCYHGEADTGGGGTDPGGLTPCTSTPECVGECATDRCVCAMTPEGMACVPGCTTAADCPTGGPTFTCRAGTCVPSGPPPGP
jgi:hypothetical protein